MLGQTIDHNLLSELPTLTRSPHDFVGLSAGAVATPTQPVASGQSLGAGVGFAINGQRPESVSLLLDGGDGNSHPGTTRPGQMVPYEAVREYRVLTNNFTAEYGRNVGFVANLVTRSGRNEFHGSVFEYVRNSALAANTFDNNAWQRPRPVFNRHQMGGSLGGPIICDKAFFFGAFESILVRSCRVKQFVVPTPELLAVSSPATQAAFGNYRLATSNTGPIRVVPPFGGGPPVMIPVFGTVSIAGPANIPGYSVGPPQNAFLGMLRTDYALGVRTLLTGRYGLQYVNQFAVPRQPYDPDLDPPLLTRNHNATLNVTRVWSPSTVTESRMAFSRLSAIRPETGSRSRFRPGISDFDGSMPTGLPAKGGPGNLYQVHQTVSRLSGNHHFKFGVDLFHYRDALHAPLYQAYYQLFYPDIINGRWTGARFPFDFLANGIEPSRWVDGQALSSSRVWHLRYNDVALFLQDTWKVARRLSVAAGLRWEYFGVQSSPGNEKVRDVNFYLGDGATYYERFANGRFLRTVDAPGKYRNHYTTPDRNNFGPRVGVAFDLDGTGTTVLRAGAGIFFDATFGRVPPTMIGSVRFYNVPFLTENPENPYAINGWGTSEPPWVERVDPDRRTPYLSSWNLSLEREFASRLVLSGAYIGSSGSSLDVVALENSKGTGRYIGRPGERLLNNYDVFLTVKGLGHSSYHGLQLGAESRHIDDLGLQFGARYTWSHSIDNASDRFIDQEREQFVVDGALPAATPLLDFTNPRLDRGNSSFDRKHRLATHFIWQIPTFRYEPRFVKHLVSGWGISGILSFQTGQPILVVDGTAPDDPYYVTRPRVTGPLPRVLSAREIIPDRRFPNNFIYLSANTFRDFHGNCIPNAAPFACVASIHDPPDNLLARNHYRGPGSHFQDLAFTKSFLVSETMRVQIRAEFYNVFNHANLETFGGRAAFVNDIIDIDGVSLTRGGLDRLRSVTSGVRVRYGGPARQVVLAARFLF
jgi:hypothetical protein